MKHSITDHDSDYVDFKSLNKRKALNLKKFVTSRYRKLLSKVNFKFFVLVVTFLVITCCEIAVEKFNLISVCAKSTDTFAPSVKSKKNYWEPQQMLDQLVNYEFDMASDHWLIVSIIQYLFVYCSYIFDNRCNSSSVVQKLR